jgi:DNA-binding SARP family transcriptional activator/TolB-like protein
MIDGDGISVRLFGKAVACSLGIDTVFPEKGFQLIALVALSSQRRITRKAVATTLWDKIDEAGALNNLRQLLARMRQQLPDLTKVITIDARNITISGQGEGVDLCRFMAGDHAEILAVYKGVLLESQSEASETFADWLQVQRTRLQEQFFRSCEQVLLDITRLGHCSVETIVAHENRLLALEPEREASYRLLIEAYGRCGHTREAARVSRVLVAIVKCEHGSAPQLETEAVVRRVLASAVTIVSASGQVEAKKTGLTPPRVAFLQPRWGNIGAPAKEQLKALIEDVVNELSRYRTFVMLAPHSSFQITHDSGLPLDNKILRADYTVSGFMKPGGSLSLRMVHFKSAAIVWAGEFPARPDYVLTCYVQLTRRIAANLASGIEKHFGEEIQLTGDRNAYQAYLAGQHAMQDCNLANLRRARKLYRESISHDPSFAPAYARVGQTLYQEWLMTGADDATLLAGARAQTDHALERDGNSGLARWMGGVISLYQRDFDVCERFFEEAEILAPNSSDLLVQHADALAFLGRPEEGMLKFNKALEINPWPPEHYWWAGASISLYQGDYPAAIDFCGRIANDESVVRILAAAHGLNGDYQRARHYGRRFRELYPHHTIEHMMRLPPDRSGDGVKKFVEGLRLAGIK